MTFVPAQRHSFDPSQDHKGVLDGVVKSEASPEVSRSPVGAFFLQLLENANFTLDSGYRVVVAAVVIWMYNANGHTGPVIEADFEDATLAAVEFSVQERAVSDNCNRGYGIQDIAWLQMKDSWRSHPMARR